MCRKDDFQVSVTDISDSERFPPPLKCPQHVIVLIPLLLCDCRLLPKIGSLHFDEPPVLPKEPPDPPKGHLFDAKNHPDHVTGDDLAWLEPPERETGGSLGLNRVTWVSFPHVCIETLEVIANR